MPSAVACAKVHSVRAWVNPSECAAVAVAVGNRCTLSRGTHRLVARASARVLLSRRCAIRYVFLLQRLARCRGTMRQAGQANVGRVHPEGFRVAGSCSASVPWRVTDEGSLDLDDRQASQVHQPTDREWVACRCSEWTGVPASRFAKEVVDNRTRHEPCRCLGRFTEVDDCDLSSGGVAGCRNDVRAHAIGAVAYQVRTSTPCT